MNKKLLFPTGFLIGVIVGSGVMYVTVVQSHKSVYNQLSFQQSLAPQIDALRTENENLQRDIETLESQLESYKMAKEETIDSELLLTKNLAESFDPEAAPTINLTEYENQELGFRLKYPSAWGDLTIIVGTPETKPEWVAKGTQILGYFSKIEKEDIYVGGISDEYKYPAGGRGLSTPEAIVWYTGSDAPYPRTHYPDPDFTKSLPEGQILYLWYSWPVGWETNDFVFAFRAPVKHEGISNIAFVGPLANSKVTSTDDVLGFLHIAHSYELLE